MICPNHYSCFLCDREFISDRAHEEAVQEHEERKQTIPGYDDGTEPITVCDYCFNELMSVPPGLMN